MDSKISERVENIKSRLTIGRYFDIVIKNNIADYYVQQPYDFDLKPTCLCPLHEESTPSFRYYRDQESFTCYGCGKSGDIISLHRFFKEVRTGGEGSVRFTEALTDLERLIEYEGTGSWTERVTEGKLLSKILAETEETEDVSRIEVIRFYSRLSSVEETAEEVKDIGVYREIDLIDRGIRTKTLSYRRARERLDSVQKRLESILRC
jgi:hypothetical protein